jgi:hypothetical protein
MSKKTPKSPQKPPFPLTVLVYSYDYGDGVPVLVVTEDIDNIPEDFHSGVVAIYCLQATQVFSVKRELE